MDILCVIDMQNDFLSGALRNEQAIAIEDSVADYIKNFNGKVFATKDTHQADYLNSREGKNLPVEHCIEGTWGHQITDKVTEALNSKNDLTIINKDTFGSKKLATKIAEISDIDKIVIIGVCTDICVISNAMTIRAFNPEIPIYIVENLCAGVTKESHQTAINAMKGCQFIVI